jgi:hypothetical protein
VNKRKKRIAAGKKTRKKELPEDNSFYIKLFQLYRNVSKMYIHTIS